MLRCLKAYTFWLFGDFLVWYFHNPVMSLRNEWYIVMKAYLLVYN